MRHVLTALALVWVVAAEADAAASTPVYEQRGGGSLNRPSPGYVAEPAAPRVTPRTRCANAASQREHEPDFAARFIHYGSLYGALLTVLAATIAVAWRLSRGR